MERILIRLTDRLYEREEGSSTITCYYVDVITHTTDDFKYDKKTFMFVLELPTPKIAHYLMRDLYSGMYDGG